MAGCAAKPTVVGRWTSDHSDEASFGTVTMEFNADGTGSRSIKTTMSSGNLSQTNSYKTSYEVQEDKLILNTYLPSGESGGTDVYFYHLVGADTLVLDLPSSHTLTLKRLKLHP